MHRKSLTCEHGNMPLSKLPYSLRADPQFLGNLLEGFP